MRASAIDAAQFAELMAKVGPFGARPRLAVATSGGADSLALCLLAAAWTRHRSGTFTALTIDHGLRSDAAAEARALGGWLEKRSIAHRIIRWHGDKPTSSSQRAAREARYRLLSGWCREHHVVHLLLGHQRDDQAETLMLRLTRGSGFDGLAAMPSVVERDGVRYLRPCLSASHAQLVTTLEQGKQPWIEDPSNRDHRYARARLRTQLTRGALTTKDVAEAARSIGIVRAERDVATSELLAKVAEIDPRGFCRLDRQPLRTSDANAIRSAVARIIMCIGGRTYAPRRARIDNLVADIRADRAFPARTLGGCSIVQRDGDLIVCREVGRVGDAARLVAGQTTRWDDRYDIKLNAVTCVKGLTVAAYGNNRWSDDRAAKYARTRANLAPVVIAPLPAVYRGTKLVAVPHLGLYDQGIIVNTRALQVVFAPRHSLTPARFSVA
jgi:tRNA(Ile)-lysidine synthase